MRCDEFRRTIPLQAKYRPWVREYFDGVPSATPVCWPPPPEGQAACEAANKYTPAAATLRASMASGAKLLSAELSAACPPLAKTDCEGRLVPWGECEATGEMSWRYTVEVEAAMGGAECPHNDGDEIRQPC